VAPCAGAGAVVGRVVCRRCGGGWFCRVVGVGGGGGVAVAAGVAAGVCLCLGRRRPGTHQDVSQCHMSPRYGRQVRRAGWRRVRRDGVRAHARTHAQRTQSQPAHTRHQRGETRRHNETHVHQEGRGAPKDEQGRTRRSAPPHTRTHTRTQTHDAEGLVCEEAAAMTTTTKAPRRHTRQAKPTHM